MGASIRTAELLCAASLATDLGTGQPLEHGLRTCAAAMSLGDAVGVDEQDRRDLYCVALLHSIGCTADAFEAAQLYGDDIAVRSGYATVDGGRPLEVMAFLRDYAGAGQQPLRRVFSFARAVAAGPKQARRGFAAHCEVASRLAERLGLPLGVQHALGFVFERWDGKGFPNGAAGEAIPQVARILHIARDGVLFMRMDGAQAAQGVLAARSGGAYEPALVELVSDELLAGVEAATWAGVLALEPGRSGVLDGNALDGACAALADFSDLKSPCTLGHSHRVAELAEAAAWRLSLDEAEVARVRRAALLQDLGRVAVSNSVWDKLGPLSEAEWERVRLHPYFTERALSRSPGLARLGEIGAAHHERVGGGGYHRGVDASQLPIAARVLAAADAYAAMTEDRPYRPALAPNAAAAQLRTAAFDPEVVEAILAAEGHRGAPLRPELPAGLSPREAQVLAHVAHGLTNKQIASRLGISPKTAGHHVGHIYAKIGVSTRAGAALFAVEHGLLAR
jgi:HD-GYP domain-containing protein (c-di-GMP phosphodiesterase class II)